MELKYTIKRLDFSPAGEFEYPHATVLVQMEPCPTLVVPAIRLQIRITSETAAAGVAAIAASALAEAQRLLPRPAAELHLQALVDEELLLQKARQACDDAAVLAALDAARPLSGG